jgi:cytosine deaminase
MTEGKFFQLQDEIRAFEADPHFPDDPYTLAALEEAVTASLEGNAGVGAVLVDPDGNIVRRDHNRIFYPYFRSDLHAEMALLTGIEEEIKGAHTLKGYTLYSSFEPCEMCRVRIINSGISKTCYIGVKGALYKPPELAEFWKNLARGQEFGPARCSPRLKEIGLELFEQTIEEVAQKLLRWR